MGHQINMINEAIQGILVSLVCLIPGFGVTQAILLSPGGQLIPYIIASSLIINTLKEVSIPLLSSNTSSMSIDAETFKVNPFEYFQVLIKHKIFCWFVGISLGVILPDFMFPKEVIIIIIYSLLLKHRVKELITTLIWFGFISGIFLLTKNSENNILLISLIAFSLPNSLNIVTKKKEKSIYLPNVQTPNYALLVLGGFLVMLMPGLSPSVIFSQLNRDYNSTQITASLADTVIESAGLTLLLRHINNGKSLIGDLSVTANLNVLLACIGVIIISYCLVSLISKIFINLYNKYEEDIALISLIITVISIIKISSIGLLLIGISIIINLLINRLKVPRNLKGYTFCVPIILN